MSTILQLAPQNVWKHFYSLTQIPRPSGHMEKITKFLIDFGKGLGLESFVDEVGNVIIRKPATPGMENRKWLGYGKCRELSAGLCQNGTVYRSDRGVC